MHFYNLKTRYLPKQLQELHLVFFIPGVSVNTAVFLFIFELSILPIMRKIIFILLLSLVFNPLHSQEIKLIKPDYQLIKSAIKDSNSPMYYPKLQQKFNAADSTMTMEERRHLYYGSIFQDNYSPYATDDNSKKLMDILRNPELTDKDFDQIIVLGDEILKKNPFNLRVLNYQLFAYEKKNEMSKLPGKITQLRIIVDAILSSGKGTTAENAIYVTNVSHEYDVINILGFEFGGKQQLIGSNDYLTLAANPMKVEGLYFDVSASLNRFQNLLDKNRPFEKTDLIGTWKIKDIANNIKKKENQQMLIDALVNSTLKFNADQTFEYSTNNNDRVAQEFKAMFQKNKWKYDAKKKTVSIGTNKDDYSIMIFTVDKIDGKTIFRTEDNGAIIEFLVEKQ